MSHYSRLAARATIWPRVQRADLAGGSRGARRTVAFYFHRLFADAFTKLRMSL